MRTLVRYSILALFKLSVQYFNIMKIAVFFTHINTQRRRAQADTILKNIATLYSYTIDNDDDEHVLRTVAYDDISALVVQRLAAVGIQSSYQDLHSLPDLEG
jgi:hypothetical protein